MERETLTPENRETIRAEMTTLGFSEYAAGGNLTNWQRPLPRGAVMYVWAGDDAPQVYPESMESPEFWSTEESRVEYEFGTGEGATPRGNFADMLAAIKARILDVESEAVARQFGRIICDRMTPGEIGWIIATNAQRNDSTCATHEICDSNMLMQEAFEIATGRDPLPDESKQPETLEHNARVWSRAWAMASAAEFYRFDLGLFEVATVFDVESGIASHNLDSFVVTAAKWFGVDMDRDDSQDWGGVFAQMFSGDTSKGGYTESEARALVYQGIRAYGTEEQAAYAEFVNSHEVISQDEFGARIDVGIAEDYPTGTRFHMFRKNYFIDENPTPEKPEFRFGLVLENRCWASATLGELIPHLFEFAQISESEE